VGSAAAVFLMLHLLPQSPGLLWQGSVVHPGCIGEFRTELSDAKAIVVAVDLDACRGSNRYSASYETAGRVLRWRDPDGDGGGSFQYEHLGVLSNGVHVVRIAESGGGSGVFQDLLFLRLGEARVTEDGRERVRHTLTLVGSETLGDRARVTVDLSGDVVTIRRREFRGAQGFGPEEVLVRTVH
jgi:hypothetical protein